MAEVNTPDSSPNMVVVQLNGRPREIPVGTSLVELIAILQLEPRYLAIERNGQVVPRKRHAETFVEPNDQLEVVTLVGGG